jgi:hypothetical protein
MVFLEIPKGIQQKTPISNGAQQQEIIKGFHILVVFLSEKLIYKGR